MTALTKAATLSKAAANTVIIYCAIHNDYDTINDCMFGIIIDCTSRAILLTLDFIVDRTILHQLQNCIVTFDIIDQIQHFGHRIKAEIFSI